MLTLIALITFAFFIFDPPAWAILTIVITLLLDGILFG